MIWGCFSCYGVGPVYHISGIMTQFEYIKMLEEAMMPYAEEKMSFKWTFQQGKPIELASWFQANKINVMDPDPIENLWSDIKNTGILFKGAREIQRNYGMYFNCPGLEYLLIGARSW